MGINLDIGCGANKQAGWTGMDIQPLPGVDIIHDFEQYPWPIEDETVLRAMASHVVEHINPANFGFVRFMDEVWRVLQPGCQFLIAAPHGRSDGYIQDPTHCNMVNETTWLYFDPLNPYCGAQLWSFYKAKPWQILDLSWDPSANIEVALAKREYSQLTSAGISYNGTG